MNHNKWNEKQTKKNIKLGMRSFQQTNKKPEFKNTVAKKKQNTHTHIIVMVILNRKWITIY